VVLCALGDCKLAACAASAGARAYCLRRLNPQTTRRDAVGGRGRVLELARVRQTEPRPLLETAVVLGTRQRGAARLLAARRPEAVGNDRRRHARKTAKQRGSPPSQAHLPLWAWTLFIPKGPGTVGPPETVGKAYPIRGQGERSFKSWQSSLPLAPRPTPTATPTLGDRSGRLLLSLLPYALWPALRAAVWAQNRRELSVLNRVRPWQAVAAQWRQLRFRAAADLRPCLPQVGTTAQGLVTNASRNRRTSAQRRRESLTGHNDFRELPLARAA
jgi:hypothetical protein